MNYKNQLEMVFLFIQPSELILNQIQLWIEAKIQ